MMNVAVIGASNKPDRYSFKAVQMLRQKGHSVFPVHVRIKEIEGLKVYPHIQDIPEDIDTITMYVSKDISSGMVQEIINCQPRRIIFNPGTENDSLEESARAQNIETIRACTLEMLKSNQF